LLQNPKTPYQKLLLNNVNNDILMIFSYCKVLLTDNE